MRSGSRLRRWAGYLCSQRTMEQLIDPVIADLQHECAEADASGHTSNKYVALLRGYVAFWILLTLHVPQVWLIGRIQAFTAGDRPTLRPSLLAAALTTALVTASLVATPARQITRHGVDGAWLLVLLIPQSLPFSIPLTIYSGVVSGLKGRSLTTRLRTIVLIIGLTGTLASVGTMLWLIPASNQAFRVAIAGFPIAPGSAEVNPRSLRNEALVLKTKGRDEEAGHLLFAYHSRWAIAGAALVFALFGLAVATLRLRGAATTAMAVVGCVLYVSYFPEVAHARFAPLSNEPISLALAWLPNLLMTVTSIAFMSVRNEPTRP